jgi:hypothetical protein
MQTRIFTKRKLERHSQIQEHWGWRRWWLHTRARRLNRTEQLRKLGNSLETTYTSSTEIGVLICHKQKQSSIAVRIAERACSPSRAVDLPGKFSALKVGAGK